MRKFGKVILCLTLALTLCMFQSKSINAESINSVDLSFTENEGRLELTAVTDNPTMIFSKINTTFVNEETSKEIAYSFFIEENNEGVHKGYVDNTYLQSGIYKLKAVSFINTDGSEELKMKKECTISTQSNAECSGYSTLLDGKWDDLKIEGKANYQIPEITSISGSGFDENIDVNNHVFNINYNMNIAKDMYTTLTFVYDSDKSSEKGTLVLNWDQEETSVYADANLRFKGENFTLAFIQLKTYQNGLFISSAYSDLSKEELLNYYNFNEGSELYSLSELPGGENFNFSVANYMEDTTAPVLLSADWKTDNVELPGLGRFEFEIEDTESGYAYMDLLTNEYLPLNGGVVLDGKGYYDFMFNRYHELDPIEVYGFYISDNAGNAVYYLLNMDEYDAETGSYYNYDLDPDVPVKEWKKPIKKLSFTRMQKYTAILNNDNEVANTLAQASENTLYVIDTNENTKIDQSVFEAIKGKDITLIFEDVTSNDVFSTGIQWIINGKDIINPKTIETEIDIQLWNNKTIGDNYGFGGVKEDWSLAEKNAFVMKMLSSQPALAYYATYINQFNANTDDFMTLFWDEFNKHQQVDFNFAENGELPGKTTIRFKPSFSLRNQLPKNDLYVFYVKDGHNELISDHVDEEKDEFYSFDITHNSKYIMTPKNLNAPDEDVPNKNDPIENVPNQDKGKGPNKVDTGDRTTSNLITWIGLGIVSIVIVSYAAMRKLKLKK